MEQFVLVLGPEVYIVSLLWESRPEVIATKFNVNRFLLTERLK
jgi:hypothetical protein